MRTSILSLVAAVIAFASSVSAATSSLDINGTYVANGKCQCLNYVDKRPCLVTPPALTVFANSILQHNPYVHPAETGAKITDPNGGTRTVKMWLYRTSIGGSEFKVRDGDDIEISLATEGNGIVVTANNKTLVQEPFSFLLQIPPNNDVGGEPGQPPKTETKIDASGLVHNQFQGGRYENNGTGEKGVSYAHFFFMAVKEAGGVLDVATVGDYKNKPDFSWGAPRGFNFSLQRCSLRKK